MAKLSRARDACSALAPRVAVPFRGVIASPSPMDASEIDVLVQRLVANPHDQEALAYAHTAGSADPKSYAAFLEKVGNSTADPAYASHWLSEAANVWSVTLGDPHRAARVLMMAVDKDPTQETAAERLGQLYREKGEHKALVALLERRAKALTPMVAKSPELRLHLAGVHEELGRLWSEPPLSATRKGIENYKRAIELDGFRRPSRCTAFASCTSKQDNGTTPSRSLRWSRPSSPTRSASWPCFATRPMPERCWATRRAPPRLFVRPTRFLRTTPASCKSWVLRFSSDTRRATPYR